MANTVQKIPDVHGNAGGPEPASGAGMDRVVARPKSWWKKGGIVFLVVLSSFMGWLIWDVGGERSLAVTSDRLTIAMVSRGTFEDFVPVRGRVTPLKTVFLDAIEGGRIEQVLVEDGALLEKGQAIVELSNTKLQLDVTRNEALVAEQLNNIRTIELQLEQNRLTHKRNLVEINYQIKKLSRTVERYRSLASLDAIARSTLEESEDDLAYYTELRKVTKESQKTDARMQEQQLVSLQDAGEQLKKNLAISRNNLDSLNVRAPVAGKLSGFSVEVGQSISQGGRLGQIDDPDTFKLIVHIDEFYLGRVDLGQQASFASGGQDYQLKITKIYPQVKNGQFKTDMTFIGENPEGIRRGQTIQAKLTLGASSEALMIPNGAFYQDTGGNWVFVVTSDGQEAIKRTVKLGRRNSRFIEVLDGLESGEKVIISPYTSYKDKDRLSMSTP